jgi:hypothetical protein
MNRAKLCIDLFYCYLTSIKDIRVLYYFDTICVRKRTDNNVAPLALAICITNASPVGVKLW